MFTARCEMKRVKVVLPRGQRLAHVDDKALIYTQTPSDNKGTSIKALLHGLLH